MGTDTKAPFILRIQMNYILLKLEGATMRTLSFDTFSEH